MPRALVVVIAVCVSSLALSCGAGGVGPSQDAVLSDTELNQFVSELDRRLTAWYGTSPLEVDALRGVVDAEVTFVAEPQTGHPYCYFSASGNVIVFDPQYKNSGCMPHEIGHWALRRAGHTGWCKFEHPGEEERSCR